jgi:outer membrane autotransporter protein
MKISGAMGYVFGNTRADRMNPSIGNFTGGTAHSEFNTNGGFAALKLSKAILVNDRWTINPYVGSSYTQQWNNGIQETGGKDFNYSIASASSYALRTFIGTDFNYPLSNFSKNPLSFVGFYRLSYNWTADKDSAYSIKATSPIFGTFNQTGANMGPVSNLFGLGLQGNINSSTSLRVGVVSSINSNGYQIGGGGELRISF